MTTGQRIKAARKKAKMTQAELAAKLGIPYQSVGQWERDVRKPKKETLANIAKELHVDPLELSDDLFDEAFLTALQKKFSSIEDFRTAFINGSVELAFLRNDNDRLLMRFYDMLNENGEREAVDLVFDLTEKKEYLKDIYTKTPEELRAARKERQSFTFPPPPEAKNPSDTK